jgi:hypothetical protein
VSWPTFKVGDGASATGKGTVPLPQATGQCTASVEEPFPASYVTQGDECVSAM